MSESSVKTASSALAITEKRTTSHRSGGCVGIFFQLFDWNRRLAKKKLFSRKLLPPTRAKQTSKRFKGDEKMHNSKLHLIADENKGGFPNTKKNSKCDSAHKKCETRSPGLVARLMGLESIPVMSEKPKKGSYSEARDNEEKKVVNGINGSENVSVKLESRPQKLQKTGQFERKQVTRFGAESAFQIKNVLTRTRKHYHYQHHYHHNQPKFVSPVKSPRIPSGKNVSRASRLIDAATRILEPGLQTASKKCAITYSSSVHCRPPNNIMPEEHVDHSSGYNADMTDALICPTSCSSCGNFLHMNCRRNVDEGSVVFTPFGPSFVKSYPYNGTATTKPKMHVSPFEREPELIFQESWEQEEMYNVQPNSKPVTERKSLGRDGLAPWPSSRQPLGRDRTPPRANLTKPNNVEIRRVASAVNAVRGTKDFVSLNRNVSSRARPRVPTRVESSNKFLPEWRGGFNAREETIPQLRSVARKRRTVNVNDRVENTGFVTSTGLKPTNAYSWNRSCVGQRVGSRDVDGATKSNNNKVISFMFNSHVRQRRECMPATEKPPVDDEIKISFQKDSSSKGDSITALLEQKLKELTSQDNDEFLPKKSTAMILQELISALTAERPDIASTSNVDENHQMPSGNCNVTTDHLSPGSVLEASFSSSSVDDGSGHTLYTDLVDYSSDQLQYSGPTDSDNSSGKTTGFEKLTLLVNTVSRVLDTINLAGGRLTETGLANAKQVIVDAELLFGYAQTRSVEGLERLFLGPILLELEAIANIAWTNIHVMTNSGDTKLGNQYRGFLFDCLIECLECMYGQYPNSGFKAWTKLPSCIDRETIIGDVEKEMKKWMGLVGMFTDEIVEWEMSHSLGKWTDFGIEAFEIGSAACDDILEALVDETLLDLWWS